MLDFLKPKRRRAEVEVVAVRMTSPHMRCITLGGAQVAAFLQADGVDAPAAWVKVFLPSGESRAYTIRHIDRSAKILDLEFVLHEQGGISGPASAWAGQARVGEKVGIGGPRDGGFRVPGDVSWIVLAGDASALPAMQSIAATLPAGITVHMYAEVGSPDDRQVVKSAAMLDITWLDEQSTPGAALLGVLSSRPLPTTPGYLWIAGESNAVWALRTHFLQRFGLTRDRVSAKGYWKLGESGHRGTPRSGHVQARETVESRGT